MRRLCLVWLSIAFGNFACRAHSDRGSEVAADARMVGGFKGLSAVDAIIRNRILTSDAEFDLRSYVALDRKDLQTKLDLLFGSYDGRNAFSKLHNPNPNAVSVMLWEMSIKRAADDIASRVCGQGGDFSKLNERWLESAVMLCDAGRMSSADTAALQGFWRAVMKYDADDAVRDAWVDEVLRDGGLGSADEGQKLVSVLLQSLMLDPHFLLEH